MRELYLMALYATRARDELADEAVSEGEHEVVLRVALAVGRDESEARVRTRERLFELYPPEEGWVNHHVVSSGLSRDALHAILESLSEEDEAGSAPELIM